MLEKAKIVVVDTQEEIPVMYNPTELQDSRSITYTSQGANLQFQQLNRDDFTVTLIFDSYEQGTDVRASTKKIEALLKPTAGTGDRREPPVCIFSWSTVWYQGVISTLNQKYTLFLSSGVPVRAELTVTFKSVLSEADELEALGLWNCRKLWTVKLSDRLDLIANTTLGNASLWQEIANLNNISDPLNFPTIADIGKLLIIPDMHV